MVSNIHQILISSSKLSVEPTRTSADHLPALQKGQLIQAQVVKPLSSRQAQLVLLGKTIVARTHTPLTAGETILLRVTKSTPPPVFKIEPAATTPLKSLLHSFKPLGPSGPFQHLAALLEAAEQQPHPKHTLSRHPAVRQLLDLLNHAALQSPKTEPRILSRLIRTSGLQWENKLAAQASFSADPTPQALEKLIETDLKALALKIVSLPQEEAAATNSLRAFADSLEQLQALNQHLWDASGKFLLHLPVWFDGMFTFGQLLVDLNAPSQSDSREERTIRISFLLEMSRVGELLADFSVLKKQIRGSFGVINTEIRQLFRENLPLLENRLKSYGFDVHPITCRVLSPKSLAGTSLIERILSDAGERVLNIVI